jgi:glycosyltransferase involved in cell wall biosynthesis
MYPQRSGGSVAFYLRAVERLAAENVECHTGLTSYNAGWLGERLPERVKKHRISAEDTAEGAPEEARYAEKIGSDWILFLFPHADDAYETAPAVRKACFVHDLQHLAFPEFFPAPERWHRDVALTRATQYADWLFTISEFTRSDLVKHYPEAAQRTLVVSSGAALPRKAPIQEAGSYILYPANFWPHKNHEKLLAAFALLGRKHPSLRLILTGDGSMASKTLKEELVKMAPAVSVTAYVSDEELDRLMIGAKCLVFPSLFEGFGIPVVEAMVRGIPVACSNTTSLPEVGGDLACYFDPCDAASIADAVSKAIALRNDAAFCSQLREHAAKFNYQATARRILEALARPVNPTHHAGKSACDFEHGRLVPLSGDFPVPGDVSWPTFPSADCVWIDAGTFESQPSRNLFVERIGLAEARSLHPSQCGDLWLRGQRNELPSERRYEEMLRRVTRGDLVARVRGLRGPSKDISWPRSCAILASQLRISGAASPEAWNAVLGLNWHWKRFPGVIAAKLLRMPTRLAGFVRAPQGNKRSLSLERFRLLARFHLGRIAFRLRILFSFQLLLTNPRRYFANIWAVSTKSFRDHPGGQFGLFRQYAPREPIAEKFPRIRTASHQLPGIALVTPSYQQGRYLEATIETILAQDYPNLEYAVVDGGSDDESAAVIERFRKRLTFAISEKDEGQADAIKKGFARLSGEIMAYVNSDDLLEAGALKFVGDFFRRHPGVDAIYGHRVIIDEAGKEVGRWVSPRYNPRLLRIVDYVPQETLFWRRLIFERVGGLDLRWSFALDWDLLLRFASAGARIVRVPYFLGRFRVHSLQKTEVLINTVGRYDIDALRRRELGFTPDSQTLEDCYRRLKRESIFWALLLRRGLRL